MPDIAGSYINISRSNITTNKSKVRQLIDIVQTDIASVDQSTRKSYEVFVSGANSQNITSSLFQTVFDQEFALGTANPLFDISMGSLLEEDGSTLTVNTLSSGLSRDAGGKIIGFTDSTPMMREKINVYRQFAQNLLGDADASFFLPHSATAEDTLTSSPDNSLTRNKKIRGAVFICFRRLFTRDNIHKGSFGLKLHKNAGKTFSDFLNASNHATANRATGTKITNIDAEITSQMITDESNSVVIIDDALSATNLTVSPVSGEVSTLKNASGTHVGNIFYDSGIIVLDAERVFDAEQLIRGIISSVSNDNVVLDEKFIAYGKINNENPAKYFYPVYTVNASGRTALASFRPYTQDSNGVDVDSGSDAVLYVDTSSGTSPADHSTTAGVTTRPDLNYPLYITGASGTLTYYTSVTNGSDQIPAGSTLHDGKLYPGLWTSGTVDEVIDHICTTRFGRGNASSMTFKNETFINSSFIFCRAAPTQLNYSTNPTYTDNDGDIVAIDNDTRNTFSYITTIGLYDAKGDLLAVAKTSRPIEKNPETDLSVRIRLDY
jgi:hypothetical protein